MSERTATCGIYVRLVLCHVGEIGRPPWKPVGHRRRISQLCRWRSACLIHNKGLCKTYRATSQYLRDVRHVWEHVLWSSCEDPHESRFATLHRVIFGHLGSYLRTGVRMRRVRPLMSDWLTSRTHGIDSSWTSPAPINLIDCSLVPDGGNER